MPGAFLKFQFPGAEINGNLDNLQGGQIIIESNAEIKQGDVENAGSIKLAPTGIMRFENHFNNTGQILPLGGSLLYWAEENGPGILDNNSTGLIKGFGLIESGSLIRNKGTIHACSGHLTIVIDGNFMNEGTIGNLPVASLNIKPTEDFNNAGTIEVNAGGGVAFDCNMVNESGATVNLLGGTLAAQTITQSADANFTGFGSITGDVIIEPDGIIELIGPTNIVGDVTIEHNAVLEISNGQTLITGRTICNGTIHIKGGSIIPQGGLSGNCNIISEPSIYSDIAGFGHNGTADFRNVALLADTWLRQTNWH